MILRRQQYVGKVRFSYFDAHVQGTKKVLLATENNVFAALNIRTGDLCEYPAPYLFVVLLPPQNIQLLRGTLSFPCCCFCCCFLNILNVLVWRHVDKAGPEGNIDILMLHGQGNLEIAFDPSDISVPFQSRTLLQLYCVVDAVMVVGNGRLLRSWDVNVGGLNWEVVLDSGR